MLRKLLLGSIASLAWLGNVSLALAVPAPVYPPSTPFTTAPAANQLSSTDKVVVIQDQTRLATVGAFAAAFGLTLPISELNFATGAYGGLTCGTLSNCVTNSNSNGGYAQWNDNHWSFFGPGVARITDKGLLDEAASTNYELWSRDATQAAWTKTNVTAAHTATGADNVPNSATVLTATGANGTVCQSVTAAGGGGGAITGEFTSSWVVKRVTGTGEVDISMENRPGNAIGTWWKPLTLTTSYQRSALTYDTTPNPTICIRLVTPGDAVAIDFVQLEPQLWMSSPIVTTTAIGTRAADKNALIGPLNTLMNSGAATVVVSNTGSPAGVFRHQGGPQTFGGTTAFSYLWQFGSAFSFWTDGTNGGSGAAPYTLCGLLANIDQNQSMALPVIFGIGWDSKGFSQSCDGGNAAYGTGIVPSSQTFYLGGGNTGPTTYITDVKFYNFRLTGSQLQAATLNANPAQITDLIPAAPAGPWNNLSQSLGYSAVVGCTDPIFANTSCQNDYGFETGSFQSGVTGIIQAGNVGNMMRFNMFANNCGRDDDCQLGNYGGSERTELDGSTGAQGNVQWASATDAWFSFSRCIEPGAPSTANWMFGFQVHQGTSPAGGGSPPFALNTSIGEFNEVEYVSNGNQATTIPFEWPTSRGKWENFVLQLNFDPSGVAGKIHIWLNGVQIVNVNGVTGETPTTGTQIYYGKFGVYRGSAAEYAAIRYANFTYSASSLAAKITSPDTIPSGYGTTCQ